MGQRTAIYSEKLIKKTEHPASSLEQARRKEFFMSDYSYNLKFERESSTNGSPLAVRASRSADGLTADKIAVIEEYNNLAKPRRLAAAESLGFFVLYTKNDKSLVLIR